MVLITVEAYKNSRVHTITIKNKELFWVRMKDVQDRLVLKNILDLLGKEMCGIYGLKRTKKCIRSEYEITKESTDNHKNKYARSDIMERIIKNCR